MLHCRLVPLVFLFAVLAACSDDTSSEATGTTTTAPTSTSTSASSTSTSPSSTTTSTAAEPVELVELCDLWFAAVDAGGAVDGAAAAELADALEGRQLGPAAAELATGAGEQRESAIAELEAAFSPVCIVGGADQSDDELFLAADGLGIVSEGDPFDASSAALAERLGPAAVDTGEIDPFSVYGTCPGERIRVQEWPGLTVIWSDAGQGLELLGWTSSQNLADPEAVFQSAPRTPDGIGLGSPGDRAQAVLGADRFVDELIGTEALSTDEGLYLTLDDAGNVMFLSSRQGCGE